MELTRRLLLLFYRELFLPKVIKESKSESEIWGCKFGFSTGSEVLFLFFVFFPSGNSVSQLKGEK